MPRIKREKNKSVLRYVKETDFGITPGAPVVRSLKLGKGPAKFSRAGIKIATPAVKPPRLLQEKIEAAVRKTFPGAFKRIKWKELSPHQQEVAIWLLNEMLEAHGSVHAQMIHPTHGQFDGTAAEAARSFVRSFAARHRIPGVDYDKAFYK